MTQLKVILARDNIVLSHKAIENAFLLPDFDWREAGIGCEIDCLVKIGVVVVQLLRHDCPRAPVRRERRPVAACACARVLRECG